MGEDILKGLELLYDGKPIHRGDFGCGTIPQLSATDALRLESAQADKLMQEILDSSQKPIELFSEAWASQISKEFEEMRRKPVDTDFPIALKSAKRKHYKPKFTL